MSLVNVTNSMYIHTFAHCTRILFSDLHPCIHAYPYLSIDHELSLVDITNSLYVHTFTYLTLLSSGSCSHIRTCISICIHRSRHQSVLSLSRTHCISTRVHIVTTSMYMHAFTHCTLCQYETYDMTIPYVQWEVGGWGRVPFSRNLMSPTPRRKWYLTTGRRAHSMVLEPIPQSLPVHFFGSRPQPPTSLYSV